MSGKGSLRYLVAGFVLFAPLPANADFATGFEAEEGYVGAPGSASTSGGASQLVPQQGWIDQFGNFFDVHTYEGAQIPWTPPSRGPELYPVEPKTLPVNPNGGKQFVALGTSDGSGGGRDQIEVAFPRGLVEVSVDFCNADEHDFPNYQGSILARDGGGHMGGVYTSAGSDEPRLNLDPPRSGPWAISVLAYDSVGNELDEGILDRFYRFEGLEGFDNLPRETWHRIGFVIDLDPASATYRQITQLKTQDLTPGGRIWIMDNPRAFEGTAQESPMYLRGGARSTEVPNLVGLYNVGNGQISMFDNLYVGPPYDWPVAREPGSARLQLAVGHDPETGNLGISWESKDGKLYNLRSTADPSAAEPIEWPIFDGRQDLAATPPENTVTFPLPDDFSRLFVIEEFNAPPVAIFADDFESGEGEWTTGSDGAAGTAWELGAPANAGPAAAHSGANCFATNIAADYGEDAEVWLRSPAIDLTTAGAATLRYVQFKDIEKDFDAGSVRVLDAADDSELVVLEAVVDDITADWEQVTRVLPSGALGKSIKIEFRFASDDISSFAGWYLDDFEVTVP